MDGRMLPGEQWSHAGAGAGDDDVEVLEVEGSPARKMPRHQSLLLQSDEGTSLQLLTDVPSPLGLRLTKSSSLVNLIQTELAQAAKRKREDTESAADTSTSDTKSIAKQITKASNFQASLLKIGAWECKSRYDGDLVAKLYFAHRKLAWEILHEGLKNKIEIQWSDISALKVTCPEGGPGTLDITLSGKPPRFFRETSPRPQRNTVWLPTADFTGGQASTNRHVLQCAPGIMNNHIDNLLSSDHRLYLLSQQNTINPENPCLQRWHSVSDVPRSANRQDFYHGDHHYQFGPRQFGESFPSHSMSVGTRTGGIHYNGAQNGMPVLFPFPSSVAGTSWRITEEPSGWRKLKSDVFNWKKFLQMHPGTQPLRSNGVVIGNHVNNEINPWNLHSSVDCSSSRMVLPEEIRKLPDDSAANQHVNLGNPPSYAAGSSHSQCDYNGTQAFLQIDSGNSLSNGFISSNKMALEQIYHNMLSDNEVADAAEEEGLMRTVNSFSGLLEQASAPAQSTQADNAQVAPDVQAPQVLNVAPSGSSGGSDSNSGNNLLPSTHMAGVPWEEPVADIEMDLAYLSELLPYIP